MAIPKLIAKFETALASGISSTATSATLVISTTKDGSVIPTAIYGFVIDEGTADEEFIIATVTDTALSSITRGISYLDGATSVTALKKAHRKGANIKITDHPALLYIVEVIKGNQPLDAVIKNPTIRTLTDPRHIVDKEYMDTAVAGAANPALLVTDAGGLNIAVNAGYYTSATAATLLYAGTASFALDNGVTNYVELNTAGTLTKNSTGFTAGYVALAIVTTAGSDITGITDARAFVGISPNLLAVASDILPDGDNTRDLGSAAKSFKDAHIQGTATVGTLAATTVTGDGSALSNMVPTMGTLAASDNLKYSADTERNHTGDAGIYQKVKEIKIRFEGTIRVKFDMKAGFNGNGSGTATGRIHKNGSVVGTERNNTTESYITYSEDIAVSAGDLIQLYYYPSYIDRTSFARNFRIYYDKSILADGVVNTD